MKIRLLILFSFISFVATAQEVVFDTIIVEKVDTQWFLTHYEKLSTGTIRGKVGGNGGTVTEPVDSLTAFRYIAGQMIQKANEHSEKEIRRMPLKELTDYLNSNDSLLIRKFGQSGKTFIRDTYKPIYLSYVISNVTQDNPAGDTSYLWKWRLLRTGGVNEDAQVLERFSTKVVRLVRSGASELVFTINSDRSFFINGLDGISRLVFHLLPTGEYAAFDESRRITHRLTRRIDSRASSEFIQSLRQK